MKNIFFLITIILLIITISACSDKSKNTAATLTAASTATPTSVSGQYATPPAFVEHPDTAKIEYPDVTIYYDDGKYIYAYNPKTQVKKQLTSGIGIRLNLKKDKFAYTFYKHDSEFASSSKQQGFYVYDLSTSEDKFISPSEDNGIDEWSPDDKYIVLDSGSYVERWKTVLNTQTGKVVAEFGTHEESYSWLSSDKIIFTDLQGGIARPYAGSAHGIAIINLNTGNKIIFKQATDTDNYSFIKIDKGKILFDKTIYKPIKMGEAIERDDPQSTYWLMDENGSSIIEAKDYKPPQYNRKDELSEEIKNLLPDSYKNYKYVWAMSLGVPNWVIIFGDNQYQYREFFIMDKTNPHSLRKIGDGASITW